MKKKELLERIELLEKRVDELEKRQINIPPITNYPYHYVLPTTHPTPDTGGNPWEHTPYIFTCNNHTF